MKQNKHYRQGDVLIECITSIPTNTSRQEPAKAIILAHGEVTGHHHILEACDPADWWKEGEIAPTLEKPSSLTGSIFVELPCGGSVVHDEHSTIELPAGNYRVTRQREYHPAALRNVQD